MPILTPEERVGTLLAGKYELIRILGEGGMGVVFEGTHTWTNRECAVKLLHPSFSRDADVARRFLLEARTATAVRHPNVVDVLDMGSEEDGTVYLVLELMHGESLSDALGRGKLEIADALSIVLPAMGAIATAHDKGIIHRDLKPENIFCHREAGELVPKVLDFGLAKALDVGASPQTRTGLVLGTPYYVSPEQAAADPSIGPPVDVWAMGVLLYECLSGRVPFAGDTATAVILKVCTVEPAPLAQVAPHVPPALATAVHRALSKSVASRYPDMRAFGNAVIEAARASGIAVVVPKGLGESGTARAEPRSGETSIDDGEVKNPLMATTPMPSFASDERSTVADVPRPAELAQSGAMIAPRAQKGPPIALLAGAAVALIVLAGVGIGIGVVVATGDEEPAAEREADPVSAAAPAAPEAPIAAPTVPSTPVTVPSTPVAAPEPAPVAEPTPEPATRIERPRPHARPRPQVRSLDPGPRPVARPRISSEW